MATPDQQRNQLDSILSTLGVDFAKVRAGDLLGPDSWYLRGQLERWAAANPNHPMATRIRQNTSAVADGIVRSLRAVRSGADASEQLGLLTQSLEGDGPAKGFEASGTAQAPAQQDPNEAERQNLTRWMTEFTQSLGRPLDMNDPVFRSLSNLGAARASMGVGANGVRVGRGGLGELAIQQGAMSAALPYAQQRQQMLQQGLNALDQRDRGIESLRQGAYGLNLQQQQMQNNVNQQMYGQQADAAGGTGGVVGGLLGGLAGGIATAATGGAAAPIIPGLIAGGSQIGAGLGQQSVQRPTFAAPRPYGSFGNRGGGY